jgi:hypothetical protein
MSMKKMFTLVAVALAFIATDSIAQDKPLSPLETAKGSIDGVNIEVVYSRPSARGRKMLGEKEPYGKIWRTGANDATSIEFSKAVKIEGKDLAAGKYSLFTIPGEKEWTIVFNKKWDQNGAWEYDKFKDQDALRVTVPAGKPAAFVETFTITVDKDKVNLQWENTAVSFKVKG